MEAEEGVMEAKGGVTEAEAGNMEAEGGVIEAKAGNMEAEEGVMETDGGVMEADLEEATKAEGGITEPHLEDDHTQKWHVRECMYKFTVWSMWSWKVQVFFV
ncbi:hypothetical protein R1flu_008260 [Riccia fluitans]|uniref:Uncharacterized protein n=1 Tax=Riccia fluitans TaxID=41844 RepID=A0ABD1YBE5_9MARC